MPLDQAVIDHRVVGGVGAVEGRAAADRRDRRRRPPRHDRRLAEAAARRRPGAGRRRPLRLRHDPRPGRRACSARRRRATSSTNPPARPLLQRRRRHQPRRRQGPLLPLHPRLPGRPRGHRRRPRIDHRPEPRARAHVARPRRPRRSRSRRSRATRTSSPRPARRSRAAPPPCSTSCASRSTSTAPRRRAVPVERVVLCGPGSAIPGLAEQMEPVLGLPIADRPARRRSPGSTRPRPPASPCPTASPWSASDAPRQPDPDRGAPRRAQADARRPARLHRRRRPGRGRCSASPLLVVTNNQISDSKAEIATLEAETGDGRSARRRRSPPTPSSTACANSASPTITSLADSRFDWERVMRELALVLPGDVWLTNLTGTASPGVSVDGAASVALRSRSPGRRSKWSAARRSQEAVAGFVAGAEGHRRRDPGRRAVLGARADRAASGSAASGPARRATSSPSSRSSSPSTPRRSQPNRRSRLRKPRRADRNSQPKRKAAEMSSSEPPDRLDPGRRRARGRLLDAAARRPSARKPDELGTQVEQLQVVPGRSAGQSRRSGRREAGSSRPTTGSSSSSARPSRRATKPPRCWSSSNRSPTGPKVKFDSIQLERLGRTADPRPHRGAPADDAIGQLRGAVPAAATVPPTEAAASLLPLGATIGPAGLGVMPYSLDLQRQTSSRSPTSSRGSTRWSSTGRPKVAVDGRLITLDGFALNAEADARIPVPERHLRRDHLRDARPARA